MTGSPWEKVLTSNSVKLEPSLGRWKGSSCPQNLATP